MQPQIIIVDDECQIRKLLFDALTIKGYQALMFGSGKEVLAVAPSIAKDGNFCIVLLDMIMPVMNGVETLNALKAILPQAAYVMLTGFASVEMLEKAYKAGATLWLAKPIGPFEVIKVIDDILEAQTHLVQQQMANMSILS
jgi:FixJ family two-component response regulator